MSTSASVPTAALSPAAASGSSESRASKGDSKSTADLPQEAPDRFDSKSTPELPQEAPDRAPIITFDAATFVTVVCACALPVVGFPLWVARKEVLRASEKLQERTRALSNSLFGRWRRTDRRQAAVGAGAAGAAQAVSGDPAGNSASLVLSYLALKRMLSFRRANKDKPADDSPQSDRFNTGSGGGGGGDGPSPGDSKGDAKAVGGGGAGKLVAGASGGAGSSMVDLTSVLFDVVPFALPYLYMLRDILAFDKGAHDFEPGLLVSHSVSYPLCDDSQRTLTGQRGCHP